MKGRDDDSEDISAGARCEDGVSDRPGTESNTVAGDGAKSPKKQSHFALLLSVNADFGKA